jgi:hypothetical protein
MEVTAQDRQQLFAWFEEHMGKERATTMMELLPEGGSSLATKADLGALRHDVEAQGAALRRDLEALEQHMDLKLERMQSSLLRTGGTWLFASQAAVITAVGVFTALG